MGGGGGGGIEETEGEKVAAAIAAEKWNYFQERLKPYQEHFIRDIQVTGRDYKQREGLSNVDAQAQVGKQNIRAGTHRSGNFSGAINRMAGAGANVTSGARVRSNIASDDAYQSALKSIVNVGTGQAASARNGIMRSASNNLQQTINDANSNFSSWQSQQDNLGSLAGMGTYQYTKDREGTLGNNRND